MVKLQLKSRHDKKSKFGIYISYFFFSKRGHTPFPFIEKRKYMSLLTEDGDR